MAEEFTEITQTNSGEAAPAAPAAEVKAEQPASEVKADEAKTEAQPGAEHAGEEATPASGGEPAAGSEAPPAKPKKLSPEEQSAVDNRIAELTKARKEAERLAETEKARADQAIEALVRLGKGPTEEQKKEIADADPKPQQPTFDDPETFAQEMATYTEQVASWAARQAVKADRAQSEATRVKETQQQQNTRIHAEHAQRRQKAIETLPDYVEVAENPKLHVSEHMAAACIVDEEGTNILFYLGKHPDEAEEISKLTPLQQFIRLGTVKAKVIASRTAAPETRLPPPIKPSGGSGGVSKNLDDLDMDGYANKAVSDGRVSKSVLSH